MILDALFVRAFSWGLAGAALATALSQFVGGFAPLIYFGRENASLLRLVKCRFDVRTLLQTCSNGVSELMNNISMSLVSMLYNIQLMKFAGENGVAAYGVLMYVSMVFQAVFIGYSVGAAPVVSYHYGAGNHTELKSLLHKSALLLGVFSLFMLLGGELLGRPLAVIFVGYDPELLDMTARAFAIFSVSFLFSGLGMFGSSFFTALNDGLTSALISFLRTMVFQISAVLIFPVFWGIDGVWWSVAAAEALAAGVALAFLYAKQNIYHYI